MDIHVQRDKVAQIFFGDGGRGFRCGFLVNLPAFAPAANNLQWQAARVRVGNSVRDDRAHARLNPCV